MKKIAFLSLIIAMNITLLSSKSIFVNSKNGNDKNDGATEKTAFATINYAISLAAAGDNIIIEGNNGKNEYNENLIIKQELSDLRIIGKNKPILNGNGINTSAGIFIQAQSITINGMKIIGFKNGDLSQSKLSGAAGIFAEQGLRDLIVENNDIEDCNYGIVLHSAEFCNIKNNTITSSLITNKSNDLRGGIGILLWSTEKFLQKNTIEGNNISKSEYAGIMMNGTTTNTDAEFSKINNNKITDSKKYGLYFNNIVNTVQVNNNTLSKNHTNLYLTGTNYDLLIENNLFETATSGVEIEASESYMGDMLFIVWQSYSNKFQSPTYAYCPKDVMTVEAINGIRKIENKKLAALNDSGVNSKISIIQYESK